MMDFERFNCCNTDSLSQRSPVVSQGPFDAVSGGRAHTRSKLSSALAATLACVLAGALAGCGGNKTTGATTTGGGGGTTTTTNPDATGNWQLNVAATTGATLFPSISGYIKENYTDTSAAKVTLAEMTATASSGCYTGTNPISFTGSTSGTSVELASLSVNGQTLALNGTLNSTSTTMSGTYTVTGGCATGAAGTFTGTLYDTVSGTYTGTIGSTTDAVSLSIKQNAQGNGNGEFELTGTGTLSGVSCFTGGTIAVPSSYVTGNTIVMVFTATDGATATVQGTIDVAADTITASSITVDGGSCSTTSLGTSTLTN